jgi:hypothetical protein
LMPPPSFEKPVFAIHLEVNIHDSIKSLIPDLPPLRQEKKP